MKVSSGNKIKRLAVIPSDPIGAYLSAGYNAKWLEEYFNPCKFFDEVYIFSSLEEDNPDLLGMKAVKTEPGELKKRLRKLNIDVVRAYGGFRPCDMACYNKLIGVPVVVSIHDTNPNLMHDSVKYADIIFCASQLTEFVSTKFKDRKRIWLLPNGVDFDLMRPYTKRDFDDLDKRYPFKHRILQIGRREKQKNLDTLIKALKILGNDYCVLAVGKGKPDIYVELAKQEGVPDRCFFIDSIKNEDLPRYFAWADCLCHPTRWEGMSLLLVEALASEAVIVVSGIPETADLIRHMDNGFVVNDYENPVALAEMIKTACTDEKAREQVRKNARKSVERFEKGRVQKLEASYYEKILAMKESGSFRIPVWKELLLSAKKMIPAPVKKTLKSIIK